MTAALAILVDAYRELNAKKLFWITLVISGLVVMVYGSIGFDDTGMSMFFGLYHIDSEFIYDGSPFAALLYRSIFSSFMVALWLAWIATILALISTTTIFPDFLAGGAIDLVLCKPLTRVKLFVLKYLASLLFVLLQVAIFCAGIFLCMGVRIGEWNWMIFAAIPLVVLFYSYLFAINVFVGVVTRSALTALLLTMLAWFSIYAVSSADVILNLITTQSEVALEGYEDRIADAESELEAIEDGSDDDVDRQREQLQDQIESFRSSRDEEATFIGKLTPWHVPVRAAQRILPKTSETIALLDRWFKRPDDLPLLDLMSGNIVRSDQGEFLLKDRNTEDEAQARLTDDLEARSWWFLIGSSLAFEAVLLFGACVIFVRRDF